MAGKKGEGDGKRKRASPGVPIPPGTVLRGVSYSSRDGNWRLGTNIGVGGFGVIFLASPDCNHEVSVDAPLVAKIEPYDNGPLFTELHAMQRIARPEFIEEWKKKQHLPFLGLAPLMGFGVHTHGDTKYRFVIMERYGEDIHKLFQDCGRRLPRQTICNIAVKVVDTLQYLHSKGYTHNDIKGANLLVGYGAKRCNDVFLIDLGLARSYLWNGKQLEHKYDRRHAHNGTKEFTCRDAHLGVTSRRGDLETLGYNLVLWETGALPWDALTDDNQVHAEKIAAFKNTTAFLKKVFSGVDSKGKKVAGATAVPKYLDNFFKLLSTAEFDAEPDYDKIRACFRSGLVEAGCSERDTKLIFPCKMGRSPSGLPKQPRRASNEENIQNGTPKRRGRPAGAGKPAKRNRRSVSTSPRIPLRHRQRNPSPMKSGVSSASTVSNDGALTDEEKKMLSGLTPAALELVSRHPHLRAKFMKNAPQVNKDSTNGSGASVNRNDSAKFRRDSDIIEKRMKAGVRSTAVINGEGDRDSNTIAGCSPARRLRNRQNLRNPRIVAEAVDVKCFWSDMDEDSGEDDLDDVPMSDLGQPTSHMVAVMSKSSTESTSSARSNSARNKGGKAPPKIDLAECDAIPTPAMLAFMQSRPDLKFKYAKSDEPVEVDPKKRPKAVGVRSSPRLRARK